MEEVVERSREADLPGGRRGSRVVIADLRVRLEHGGVEYRDGPGQPEAVASVGDGASHVPDQGSRPVSQHGIDARVGDLAEALLPGDAHPPARAPGSDALQGMEQTRRVVHAFAVAGALLAAARIEVGHQGIRLRVVGDLLLAPDDSVLHVDVPGAAALIGAVHVVGAARHPVPDPTLPVEILPVAIGGPHTHVAKCRSHAGIRPAALRHPPGELRERKRYSGATRAPQERASTEKFPAPVHRASVLLAAVLHALVRLAIEMHDTQRNSHGPPGGRRARRRPSTDRVLSRPADGPASGRGTEERG
jgi:hypothetical protein